MCDCKTEFRHKMMRDKLEPSIDAEQSILIRIAPNGGVYVYPSAAGNERLLATRFHRLVDMLSKHPHQVDMWSGYDSPAEGSGCASSHHAEILGSKL